MEVVPAKLKEIQSSPLFEGIQERALENLLPDIHVCKAGNGDIVCKQGAYGDTAFFIVEGEVEITLKAPATSSESSGKAPKKKKPSFIASLFSKRSESGKGSQDLDNLYVGGQNTRILKAKPDHIETIDMPIPIRSDRPTIKLGANELFGEMSALSKYPRSATVTARKPSVLLQVTGRVLSFVMKRNKTFKATIDQRYRERALATHLRNVELFENVPDDILEKLIEEVHFLSFEPGELIFEEGSIGDSFYLIRAGFVRVSRETPGGGQLNIAYLSKGSYFGEIALVKDVPRTASVTAFDHVELVEIKRPHFQKLLGQVPQLKVDIHAEADRRLNETRSFSDHIHDSMMLQFAVDSGILNAESLLLIDLNKCTRCDDCTSACSSIHEGQTRLIRSGPVFLNYLLPTSCRQCTDPVCMVGCPTGAIVRAESGQIEITSSCIGCDSCAKRCPYGTIIMVEEDEGESTAKKATKCDLCSGLSYASCVYNCPHGAAHRVNPETFFANLSRTF